MNYIPFNNLKLITIEIDNKFNNIINKNNYIKEIHSNYLIKYNINDNYKISLDILNYQSNLIYLEYKKNHDLYLKFINNMYGHYFKLYNNIINYIDEIKDKTNININSKKFEPFNDIKDITKFKIENSEEIFNKINEYLLLINNYIKLQTEDIKIDKITKKSGIYLNNFINEKEYNINILEEKIKLFVNNFISYYDFHYNFLKRLLYKLNLEKNYIDNKINSNIDNKNIKNLIYKYKLVKSNNLEHIHKKSILLISLFTNFICYLFYLYARNKIPI